MKVSFRSLFNEVALISCKSTTFFEVLILTTPHNFSDGAFVFMETKPTKMVDGDLSPSFVLLCASTEKLLVYFDYKINSKLMWLHSILRNCFTENVVCCRWHFLEHPSNNFDRSSSSANFLNKVEDLEASLPQQTEIRNNLVRLTIMLYVLILFFCIDAADVQRTDLEDC